MTDVLTFRPAGQLMRPGGRRLAAAILISVGALAIGPVSVLAPPAWAAGPAATGPAWSVEPTPNAQVANGALAAVNCAGTAMCVAVGSYHDSSGTSALAEVWNGTTWRIEPVPTPPGGTNAALDGVSCSGATACTAVGNYTNNQGVQVTLAEGWNGSIWSAQPTPNPAVATLSILTSVSCGAPGSCVAVGYYGYPRGGQARLAESWHGTSWSLTQAGNPPNGAYGNLNSVSCTAAAACLAVGDYLDLTTDDTVTLAQVWNGTTWKVTASANPADSIVTRLFGVSCTSPAACTAVGYSIFDATRKSAAQQGGPLAVTLAESWNGTTWTIRATPNPAGTTGGLDILDSVSCASPTSCNAVGSAAGAGAGPKTLGEVWNGTAWTIAATPDPGHGYNSLAGVSCSAAAACAAVGAYHDTTGTHLPLAQAWNGTAWTVQAVPSPVGAVTSDLTGVSCGAPRACTAVGLFDNSPGSSMTLAEAWNGTAWQIQPTPDPAGFLHSTLASVSCGSASACMAVGRSYTQIFSGGATLAESWNGSAWTIKPGATLPGTDGALSGVSCTSPTACMAVGDYTGTAGSGLPLAESWNGTAWTVHSVPVPAGGSDGVLNGVSCTSPTSCTAVGSYTSSGADVGLAERWDGTAWTVQATPAGDDILTGVSCASATTCTAVGNSFSYPAGETTLAEGWQHGTWSVKPTPFLPGPFFHTFNGVSCRSAVVCAAVGNYSTGLGVSVTLAEAWNGSTWTVQTTPPPSSGTNSVLAGVSATPGAGFTAVGGHLGSAGVGVTLAETGPG